MNYKPNKSNRDRTKMKSTNTSPNIQDKFFKFYIKSWNHQKELNHREIMRIANSAAYLTGILGYDKPIADADTNTMEWNFIPLPLVAAVLLCPFILVNLINEFHHDVYKVLTLVPILISATLTMVQGFRLLILEVETKDFYGYVYKSWDKELRNGIDDEIAKEARKYISFAKFYAIAITISLIPWILRPFNAVFVYYVLNGNETFMNTRVLPTTYPFAVDNIWIWIFCNIWEAWGVAYVAIVVVTTDVSFIQVCALVSLQLQVVANKMQNIVKQNDRTENDCRLVNRLHAVGKQHDQLLTLCQRIANAFNPIMLTIMILASISLCVCVVTMENELSKNNFGTAAISLSHFGVVLVQTIVYCDTAENIGHWLSCIPHAISESDWVGHSKEFQKIVMLIVLRSQRPFKFKTYGMYDVDREQLRKIMYLALNSFMILRNIRSFKA